MSEMNAEKAREIVDQCAKYPQTVESAAQNKQFGMALGYLKCLSGPEVKALEVVLEKIQAICDSFGKQPMPQSTCLCGKLAVEALAVFRKAVQP